MRCKVEEKISEGEGRRKFFLYAIKKKIRMKEKIGNKGGSEWNIKY